MFTIVANTAAAQRWTAADTGRMMPGDRDFSRYTPAMCIEAMESVRNSIWRHFERDTAGIPPDRDTLPTAALAAGKACAAQFTVAGTAPRDLWNLRRLALVIGDESMAEAVTARQLTLASTDTGRAEVLLEAVEAYAEARPIRIAGMQAVLAQLDAMGPSARIARLFAHETVAGYSATVFDTTAMLREARAIRALIPSLTNEEKDEFFGALVSAYQTETRVAWFRVQDSTLRFVVDMIFQVAQRELGFAPCSSIGKQLQGMRMLVTSLAASASGRAPRIRAAYWYNDSAGVSYPQPGKVTLVWSLSNDWLPRLAMFRRLQEKYGPQGFQVVVVAPEDGHSWASPPQSALDEANTLAWYYLEHFHLPFVLAVDTAPRRKGASTAFGAAYRSPAGAQAIIGRDGMIRTRTYGVGSLEAETEAYIKQALAHTPH
jgi:hypothetical protein